MMIFLNNLFWRIKDWWRGNISLFGGLRSNQWSSVRKDFLILHPTCECCGKKGSLLKPLEVHHCIPFSQDKSLELDMRNLITVCRTDHLFVCHLNSWKSWNKDVRTDADLWREKIENRP
jgi:5-methylcytosine-specific restriction enzyme A